MKKILIIIAIMANSLAITAAETAYLGFQVVNKNNTADDVLSLVENTSYSTARDKGADQDKYISITNPSVNICLYAFGSFSNTGKLAMLATNHLEGEYIGFKANTAEVEYTINFIDIEYADGREPLFLEDLKLKTLTEILQDGSYTFTIDDSQKGAYIDNRFRIYKPYDFQVCAYYDNVVITGNTSTDNVIITNNAGDTIVNVAPTKLEQIIDLSGKPSGHYILMVNGTQYEFCNKPSAN